MNSFDNRINGTFGLYPEHMKAFRKIKIAIFTNDLTHLNFEVIISEQLK